MSENEILLGGALTVRLCNREYTWPEPVRRQRRQMMARLLEVQGGRQFASPEEAQAWLNENPVEALAFVDRVQDFLYEFHPGMAADKPLLDDATETEIADAFRLVSEFILRPFATTTASPGAGAGKKTRTLKAVSTRS